MPVVSQHAFAQPGQYAERKIGRLLQRFGLFEREIFADENAVAVIVQMQDQSGIDAIAVEHQCRKCGAKRGLVRDQQAGRTQIGNAPAFGHSQAKSRAFSHFCCAFEQPDCRPGGDHLFGIAEHSR